MSIEKMVDDYGKGGNLINSVEEKTREVMVEWTNNKFIQFPFLILHVILITIGLKVIYQSLNIFLGKILNMDKRYSQIINLILSLMFLVFFIFYIILNNLNMIH